jgi:hypothetical protein
MRQDAAFLAERFVWCFNKSGETGKYTRPFEHLEPTSSEILLSQIVLGEEEIPAVSCYISEQQWCLITTQRVVWLKENEQKSVWLDDVVDATVDPMSLMLAGSKKGLTRLTLVTKLGAKHELELEPGQPFSGFWNVLKMIAARTKRKNEKAMES